MSDLPPLTVFLNSRVRSQTFRCHDASFDHAQYQEDLKVVEQLNKIRDNLAQERIGDPELVSPVPEPLPTTAMAFPQGRRFLYNRLATSTLDSATEKLRFLEDMGILMAIDTEFFSQIQMEVMAFVHQSVMTATASTESARAGENADASRPAVQVSGSDASEIALVRQSSLKAIYSHKMPNMISAETEVVRRDFRYLLQHAQPEEPGLTMKDNRSRVFKVAHTGLSRQGPALACVGADGYEWDPILTVRSKLGESIDKAVRCSFGRSLVMDEVIEKLNRDPSKPWFGWKKPGSIARDLGVTAYEEVILLVCILKDEPIEEMLGNALYGIYRSFVEPFISDTLPTFSFLKPRGNVPTFYKSGMDVAFMAFWFFAYAIYRVPRVDPSFLPLVDLIQPVVMSLVYHLVGFQPRFRQSGNGAEQNKIPFSQRKPVFSVRLLVASAPYHSEYPCTAADKLLNEELKGEEPRKAAELRIPMYSTALKEIPGSINSSLIDRLLEHKYSGDISKAPVVDYLAARPVQPSTLSLVSSAVANSWLDVLAGSELDWLHALISSAVIVQGSSYTSNPLRRLLTPCPNQKSDFKAVEVFYAAESNVVGLTVFEDRLGSSSPLHLRFLYKPPWAPPPFTKLSRVATIASRTSNGSCEVTLEAAAIEQFCAVVGNRGESSKTVRQSKINAPMDFAIVAGWQAIIEAIFPKATDGDLLKLVRLSNSFAGDACRSEGKVVSVVNGSAGKVVKVRGHVIRYNLNAVEVVSAFLYRGNFTDFENAFETTQEPDYAVDFPTDATVGVLLSKEWFDWDDESKPLTAGSSLIFRIESSVSFKDRTSFRDVIVTGDIFVRDQLNKLVKVGSIDFHQVFPHGNPILAYLQRHGRPEGLTISLPNDGYLLTKANDSTTFNAPLNNEPYSGVSGDFNPVHINPCFSCYASLPATIAHRLWSSVATRLRVENVVAKGHPDRVSSYDVSFAGMVLPGDELDVKIRHTGMHGGIVAVKVETVNARGEKVLEGSAEVAQPNTVYVFTGQDSQEQGMGMDLYSSSPAARAVWDGADAHLRAVYGFSILYVVKDNPKEKSIHFGGLRGQEIPQRYMDMSYDALDKDGNVRTLPLFADVDIRTPKYTFSHPNGLLFATQFAQIALVVTEKATFEDMRAKGFVQQDCAFAGRSLGEYAALAYIADVLPISSLVDVVFYLGITMQRAVERDSEGRSNYAMCTVNPSRISMTFSDAALREVVDTVAAKTGALLEIVNFNVEGQQYVCAGELVALQTMTNVLNYLKVKKGHLEKVTEMLTDIVNECHARALDQQKAEGHIRLERGFATIPLPGIDVPFHSRYLWAGIMPFRTYLSKKINPTHLNPDMLIGKYIPNLIAKPFEVALDYAQTIYGQTSSPRLDKVLKKRDQEKRGSPEQRQKLAYSILVELLAYRFATPVLWIQTQGLLFTQFRFERLVELGPSPTLTGMATRTLKAKYETEDDCVSHNPKEKTVRFGALRGQETRQRHMDMDYGSLDKDGNVRTLPLFADVDILSFKDRTSFRDFTVMGDIFMRDQLKNRWLPARPTVSLPNDGYYLTKANGSTTFHAPLTNDAIRFYFTLNESAPSLQPSSTHIPRRLSNFRLLMAQFTSSLLPKGLVRNLCLSFLFPMRRLRFGLSSAAEDTEVVFDQDPQRVCILEGPVAVERSEAKGEPIGSISSPVIDHLLECQYSGNISKAPVVNYLAARPVRSSALSWVSSTVGDQEIVYQLAKHFPDTKPWLDSLAGSELNWFHALVSSAVIAQAHFPCLVPNRLCSSNSLLFTEDVDVLILALRLLRPSPQCWSQPPAAALRKRHEVEHEQRLWPESHHRSSMDLITHIAELLQVGLEDTPSRPSCSHCNTGCVCEIQAQVLRKAATDVAGPSCTLANSNAEALLSFVTSVHQHFVLCILELDPSATKQKKDVTMERQEEKVPIEREGRKRSVPYNSLFDAASELTFVDSTVTLVNGDKRKFRYGRDILGSYAGRVGVGVGLLGYNWPLMVLLDLELGNAPSVVCRCRILLVKSFELFCSLHYAWAFFPERTDRLLPLTPPLRQVLRHTTPNQFKLCPSFFIHLRATTSLIDQAASFRLFHHAALQPEESTGNNGTTASPFTGSGSCEASSSNAAEVSTTPQTTAVDEPRTSSDTKTEDLEVQTGYSTPQFSLDFMPDVVLPSANFAETDRQVEKMREGPLYTSGDQRTEEKRRQKRSRKDRITRNLDVPNSSQPAFSPSLCRQVIPARMCLRATEDTYVNALSSITPVMLKLFNSLDGFAIKMDQLQRTASVLVI
ncbi:hypothetical protein K435DRAFT_852388 [Dendrothele bispora CBS 962.96]|uniref:Malonyl-CoA:ACP transacylase (MAT) domain-containing protein n=1 Tax=Dendrothele bispora (strain CBS 962.96) TaxID=1314807 RepID=A0A4S8ML45_DENBC|nr:hypothetical protein K435DRAFT_852388 [Dendrothele bispora CBS 962.96]